MCDIPKNCDECGRFHTCVNAHYGSRHCKPIKADRGNNMNSNGIHMTGHIVDKIYKNGKLVDVIEGHNIVVNSFVKLVMALCKGQSGYGGIKYWAVGSGETSWDTTLPNPEVNATRLTTEVGRVAIAESDISFLNSDMSESSTPTNIIRIKHVFGANDCNGKWREFGIFGGDATGTANSGIMINKRHHSLINKTSDMSIERTMTFTLNLV